MKKLFIWLLLILLLFAGAVYWGLNKPQATVAMISFIANQPDSGFSLKSFKVSQQKFSFLGMMTIKKIEMDLVSDNVLYGIDIDEFRVVNLYKLFSEKTFGSIIDLNGMDLKSEGSNIEDADITLEQEQGYNFKGSLKVSRIDVQGVIAKDTTSKINISQEKIELSDINLETCDGFVKGNADVYLNKPDFKINLQLEGLNSAMLEHIYPPVLSNVKGKVSGNIFLNGLAGGIENIECDFNMNQGSELNAVLLAALMAYIPDQAKTDKLINAIKRGELFAGDKGQVRVYNENDQSLSSNILLQSKEMNLDVNVTVDFNIEGGIRNLLKYSFKKS